jgi:hypothetical protein
MAGTEDLIRAVELAGAGDWEAAHRIVQAHEDGTAYWLHALLHKIEGDETNSRYWYARAGRAYAEYAEPTAELAAIRDALSA